MEWKQLSVPDRSFKWLNGVFMACTSHLLVSTKLQFKTFNETNVCRKGINGVISRRDGYIRGNLWLLSWHWLCLCFSFFLGCSVGMVFCMSLPLCCVGKSVLGKVKGSWKEQTKKTQLTFLIHSFYSLSLVCESMREKVWTGSSAV